MINVYSELTAHRKEYRNMNEKKKVNIIDLIIIISVLIIIGVSVYRAISVKKVNTDTDKKSIEYNVVIQELDSIYGSSLSEGEEIYLADKSIVCGKITSIKSEYTKVSKEYTNQDGQSYSLLKTDPSKVNVTLTVECTGSIFDNLLYLGESVYVCKGQTLDLYTDTFTFSGLVTDYHEK